LSKGALSFKGEVGSEDPCMRAQPFGN